jgi:diaminobutyrate-2-oxoglutarate transaminase
MIEVESKVASYNKTFTEIFDKASGSYMYDKDNNEYLDFFTGAGTMNYGHNNEISNNAMINHINHGGILHSLDLDTVEKINFMNTIQEVILKPRNLDYKIQLVSPSGTNSVEAAFKLARKNTQRRKILAFTGGFHGMTLGSLGATANKAYKDEIYPDTEVTSIPFENYLEGLDSLDLLEKTLQDDGSGTTIPAGIIIETVQSDGGVNIASIEFLQRLRSICTKYNIMMIVDDIQVGNGRTGDFFSFERADIVPDIVCISKGIGGGMPLSILLFKKELDIWNKGEHSGTFRGNNLSFVSGSSIIRHYWSTDNFSKEIKEKENIVSKYLKESLNDHSYRGIGLIWGIVLTPEKASAIRDSLFKDNLIIEIVGSDDSILKIMPPLTISNEDLVKGLEKIIKHIKGSK